MRKFTMSPIEPRTAGSLRGFGFTVTWGEPNAPVTDGGEAKSIRSSRTGGEEPTPSPKFPASDKQWETGLGYESTAVDQSGPGSKGLGFVLDREVTVHSPAPTPPVDTPPKPNNDDFARIQVIGSIR